MLKERLVICPSDSLICKDFHFLPVKNLTALYSAHSRLCTNADHRYAFSVDLFVLCFQHQSTNQPALTTVTLNHPAHMTSFWILPAHRLLSEHAHFSGLEKNRDFFWVCAFQGSCVASPGTAWSDELLFGSDEKNIGKR